MNLPELCIRRPVATTLVMLAILLFGVMGYRLLPVSDLPNVDFPTILVSGGPAGRQPRHDGLGGGHAAGEAVLHHRRHRLDDLHAASLGTTQITLQFALSRNIDAAAQDVQAAIARAARKLPPTCPPRRPTRRSTRPTSRSCTWR